MEGAAEGDSRRRANARARARARELSRERRRRTSRACSSGNAARNARTKLALSRATAPSLTPAVGSGKLRPTPAGLSRYSTPAKRFHEYSFGVRRGGDDDSTANGPSSAHSPSIDEQPGPPLSQIATGAAAGSTSDASTYT